MPRVSNRSNGKIYSSTLFGMNNRGYIPATQATFKNQGRLFKQTLSMKSPYYTDANPRYNPGTYGLRMVSAPKPNQPETAAEHIKPDDFGKSRSAVENGAIHASNVIGATNGARTGNGRTD